MSVCETCENTLEKELFKSVYEKTPDYIKNTTLLDFSQKGEFVFKLKKEHLYPYDEKNNPKHNISFTRSNGSFMTYFTKWLDEYTKENGNQTGNKLISYYEAWKEKYS